MGTGQIRPGPDPRTRSVACLRPQLLVQDFALWSQYACFQCSWTSEVNFPRHSSVTSSISSLVITAPIRDLPLGNHSASLLSLHDCHDFDDSLDLELAWKGIVLGFAFEFLKLWSSTFVLLRFSELRLRGWRIVIDVIWLLRLSEFLCVDHCRVRNWSSKGLFLGFGSWSLLKLQSSSFFFLRFLELRCRG